MLANSLNTGSSRSHRAPCVHLDDAMLATASAVSAHRSHAAETRGTRASTPYAARETRRAAAAAANSDRHTSSPYVPDRTSVRISNRKSIAPCAAFVLGLSRACSSSDVKARMSSAYSSTRDARNDGDEMISPPPCARRDSFRTGIARWARCTPCRSSRPCTQSYPWPDSVSIARITPRRGINSDARQTRHPSPTSTRRSPFPIHRAGTR